MPSAADRQRRFRQRARRGEAVFRVTVPHDAVVEALLISRRLTDEESRRRHLVERELAGVLREWALRWLDEEKA